VSQKHERRWSSCTSKSTYRDYRFARSAAKRIEQKYGEYLETYVCEFCLFFHNGHIRGDDPYLEKAEWYCE
jgi:hypothetical protein